MLFLYWCITLLVFQAGIKNWVRDRIFAMQVEVDDSLEPLSLTHIIGLFYLLLIGVAIGTIAFVFEMIFFRW